MDDAWLPQRPTLRPGLRVVRRDDRHLQVGVHPGQRVVLPDDPTVRAVLADLRAGRRPPVTDPSVRRCCRALAGRGLLVDADEVGRALAGPVPRPGVLAAVAQAGADARARLEARSHARIDVVAEEPWRAAALRLMVQVGLPVAGPRDPVTVRLAVVAAGEPVRSTLDPWMRAGEPHLLVSNLDARVRVGPFVLPGVTACLRCVDAHRCDADPGHALVVEQHPPEPGEPCDPVLMHLALAWAVRDLLTYVEGEPPATWSATVGLTDGLAVERQPWTRHPRCGCSWGEGLVAG
jgi:hypothetical protein